MDLQPMKAKKYHFRKCLVNTCEHPPVNTVIFRFCSFLCVLECVYMCVQIVWVQVFTSVHWMVGKMAQKATKHALSVDV